MAQNKGTNCRNANDSQNSNSYTQNGNGQNSYSKNSNSQNKSEKKNAQNKSENKSANNMKNGYQNYCSRQGHLGLRVAYYKL